MPAAPGPLGRITRRTFILTGDELKLLLLPDRFAVCRLEPDAAVPDWALSSSVGLRSITRTDDELSIVCGENDVPEGVKCESGWRAMRVAGTLDFSLSGVLASLATPLADAGVSIFAVSTFDTDYLLVRDDDVGRAVHALQAAGHEVL